MKYAYPTISHKSEDKIPYFVEIPDLAVMTQGASLENVMAMASEVARIAVAE